MHPVLACIVVALATWDSWRWYVLRVVAAPDEVAVFALAVAVLALTAVPRHEGAQTGYQLDGRSLTGLSILLVVHAVSQDVLPPIVRAAIAISATIACAYVAFAKARPPLALWGAIALALPVLPSMQFMLGYPMRVVSAEMTVALLQMQGLAIERQGTLLVWRGEWIQFDAPCSGVRMLWAGLLLTLLGCMAMRLNASRTLLAIGASLALTLVANVLRATSLFTIEAKLVPQPPAWWHEGVGIVAFAFAAAATLWLLQRLKTA